MFTATSSYISRLAVAVVARDKCGHSKWMEVLVLPLLEGCNLVLPMKLASLEEPQKMVQVSLNDQIECNWKLH